MVEADVLQRQRRKWENVKQFVDTNLKGYQNPGCRNEDLCNADDNPPLAYLLVRVHMPPHESVMIRLTQDASSCIHRMKRSSQAMYHKI